MPSSARVSRKDRYNMLNTGCSPFWLGSKEFASECTAWTNKAILKSLD